jgi:putative transposase
MLFLLIRTATMIPKYPEFEGNRVSLPDAWGILMSHTYVSDLVHCVFSPKNLRNLTQPEIQPPLWSFIGGIARKNGFKALIVGGTENHVHILPSLPATMPLAKAMQLINGGSSHRMNETPVEDFAWQEGNGAFTVGISQKADTISYIESQPEHHRKRSFEEEFTVFLKRHGVAYDPRYVWG